MEVCCFLAYVGSLQFPQLFGPSLALSLQLTRLTADLVGFRMGYRISFCIILEMIWGWEHRLISEQKGVSTVAPSEVPSVGAQE